MKHTFKAVVTNIDFACAFKSDVLGPSEPPSITFLLIGLEDETPKSINEKLLFLVGGTHGEGRVTVTIARG